MSKNSTARHNVGRRALLQAAALSTGIAVGHSRRAAAAGMLTINAYGGEYKGILLKTVIEPFQAKFNATVRYDDTGTASENYAKIRASHGAPGFDVAVELNPPEIILGSREKTLEPLDETKIPNLKFLPKAYRDLIPPFGAVHYNQLTPLLWNTKSLERPTSWASYWDPKSVYGDKIKGRLMSFNPANLVSVNALIMAARLGGGDENNMEPAWDYLNRQRPYVGPIVTTSAQAAPYFENGDVWLAPYGSARAGYYAAHGYPISTVIPKEGVLPLPTAAAVPVGSRNKDLAYAFVNFLLEPEIQRNFCIAYFCSPARLDLTGWAPDFAAGQITTDEQLKQVVLPNFETIGLKRRDWTLRWQQVMGA
jgi:putative spermidine/putrescine transport system substrate-binding protein